MAQQLLQISLWHQTVGLDHAKYRFHFLHQSLVLAALCRRIAGLQQHGQIRPSKLGTHVAAYMVGQQVAIRARNLA